MQNNCTAKPLEWALDDENDYRARTPLGQYVVYKYDDGWLAQLWDGPDNCIAADVPGGPSFDNSEDGKQACAKHWQAFVQSCVSVVGGEGLS